jgi:hypothetical protein
MRGRGVSSEAKAYAPGALRGGGAADRAGFTAASDSRAITRTRPVRLAAIFPFVVATDC